MHSNLKICHSSNRSLLYILRFQERSIFNKIFFGVIICVTCLVNTIAGNTEEIKPIDQFELLELLKQKGQSEAFLKAFALGDKLTKFQFKVSHGVGANVKNGQRFSRIPRAAFEGDDEWASHFPKRESGPSATSCVACHNAPIEDGAGGIESNVLIDPGHSGDPTKFLERNTPHLMGLGAVQRIAEEMSNDLLDIKAQSGDRACAAQTNIKSELISKSVNFGSIIARPGLKAGGSCIPEFDLSGISGVDKDLIIKAFGWKGTVATRLTRMC